MKSIILLYLAFSIFLIAGCSSEHPKEEVTQNSEKNDTGTKIANAAIDTLSAPEVNIDHSPSPILFNMIQYLDSLGYGCDGKYVCSKKVAEPCVCEISLEKHALEDTVYKYRLGYDHIDPKTINRELLHKVVAVNAFPYSVKKKGKDINADGIIEEWVFQNETIAEEAGLEWNRIRNFIFHHTASYVCRKLNRLYIFHNRAAFDKIHRETIKRFHGQFDLEYPATIPNSQD